MKFLKNNYGVFELPVQYMVAIVVAAMAIFLISSTIYNLWRDHEIKAAMKEVRKIIDEAEEMMAAAAEGTKTTMDINLPDSVDKVILGSNDEKLKNRCCLIMKWGTNKTFFTQNARFSHTVLYGGKQTIILELVTAEGGNYVKIYKM